MSSGIYKRHTSEATLLHRVVREHLETFLAVTRTDDADTLPRYVEQEFRKYVRCGILAQVGLSSEPTPISRAWDPPDSAAPMPFDAHP